MANTSGLGTFVNDEFEMATDALDFFTMPPVESAQIHGRTSVYYPHATINNSGPYEIIIPNDRYESLKRKEQNLDI